MKMNRPLPLAVLTLFVSSSVSAYVLLSPRRTWDVDPNVRIDNRGNPTVTDGVGGRDAVRNAIVSSAAWNGAGAGTVVNATVASVSGFRLGDGIPMLNFRDPVGACSGSCLAATFTGYYQRRPNGTFRIFDADIVTNPTRNFASAGEACSGHRVPHRRRHGPRGRAPAGARAHERVRGHDVPLGQRLQQQPGLHGGR